MNLMEEHFATIYLKWHQGDHTVDIKKYIREVELLRSKDEQRFNKPVKTK